MLFSKKTWLCAVLFLAAKTYAQQQVSTALYTDTLSLTIDSAEGRFLRQNYSLLAQRYNIDAQKALIVQAKLFPNPNLSIANLPYNQDSKSVFPVGKNGEWTVGLSQVIQLAGKRNKNIKLAEANAQLSEYQFFDLINTLKYTLHTDFYTLYYAQQSAKSYSEEINALKEVVKAFDAQQGKGYISEKEVIRVKAHLYALQSEYSDLLNTMNDTQSEIRSIIQQQNVAIVPTVNPADLSALTPDKYPLGSLLDSAYANRTDLKIAKAGTNINQLSLAYQKALATPDLTLSANYDQAGGKINHQVQVGVAMDLPFFNRNQGNIKSAQAQIEQSKAVELGTQAGVAESVTRALQRAYDMDKMSKNIDPKFEGDFQRLQKEVLLNYQKRNIGLLDFLDFYDSYKNNILQMNNILNNRMQAFESINYFTATNFFN